MDHSEVNTSIKNLAMNTSSSFTRILNTTSNKIKLILKNHSVQETLAQQRSTIYLQLK